MSQGTELEVRIGHFVEAQILEALDIDYIDESEVIYHHRAETRDRELVLV